MSKSYLFDGQKSVNIDDLPPEAWTGGSSAKTGDIQKYRKTVPWLYRATELRSKAVAHLPFAIVNEAGDEIDTSDDYQNKVGFLPNPSQLLELIEASLVLQGEAYLYRARNLVRDVYLRYVLASSITPKIDEVNGLTGFTRQVGAQHLDWSLDEVVYFWLSDPYVELGPPAAWPAAAACAAAGVLHNLEKYAASYFARGAIRPMIMTVPTRPTPAEEGRIKAWLRKVFLGIDNAYTAHIFEEGTDFKTIGDGIGELSDSNLTHEQREDISVALGIPMTIMWSTEASGLGGGGVTSSDERKLYEQTIVPESLFIQAVLNGQLFRPMRLRWVFRPETLDVFQEDEGLRANALTQYVNAGFRLSLAAQVLGVELPEGVEYDDLDTMQQEDKDRAAERQRQAFEQRLPQNPQPNPQQANMRADLERWERKALSKGADCSFESEYIPDDVMGAIRARLKNATTAEEVKAAFAAPFRQSEWSNYP